MPTYPTSAAVRSPWPLTSPWVSGGWSQPSGQLPRPLLNRSWRRPVPIRRDQVIPLPVPGSPGRSMRPELTMDGLGAYYRGLGRVFYQDGSAVNYGMGEVCPCVEGCGLAGFGQLGQQISGQSLAISATQIAGGVTSAIAAGGTAAAPAILGLTAAAVPIIGAAVAGVTVAISLLWNLHHDPRKNATTSIVNQIEPKLQENLSGYMSGPRTMSSQAQALANFDAAWALVLQNCNQPQFGQAEGEPGYNCIHDREAGACHWHNAAGECFNWFTGYRDPIANDRQVKPDPVTDEGGNVITMPGANGQPGGATAASGDYSRLLLVAGLAIAGIMLAGSN